jgi:hypothetical protein
MDENGWEWGKLEKRSCFKVMSFRRVSNEDFKRGETGVIRILEWGEITHCQGLFPQSG